MTPLAAGPRRYDDVDQDLACGWRRRLVHLEELDGLAECCDPGRSHPFGARYWRR